MLSPRKKKKSVYETSSFREAWRTSLQYSGTDIEKLKAQGGSDERDLGLTVKESTAIKPSFNPEKKVVYHTRASNKPMRPETAKKWEEAQKRIQYVKENRVAEQQNQQAHQQSLKQAQKELAKEYVRKNWEEVYQHPLWQAPGMVSPFGIEDALIAGAVKNLPKAVNVTKNLFKSLPTDFRLAERTGAMGKNVKNATIEAINKVGETHLPNLYKINPLAKGNILNPFEKSSFLRQVDEETFKEALESGLIRGKQNVSTGDGININKYFGDDAYYNKGSLYYGQDLNKYPYLFEARLPEDRFIPKVNGRTKKYTTENTSVRVSKDPISIHDENINIYKKHWRKGYKKLQKPNTDMKNKNKLKKFALGGNIGRALAKRLAYTNTPINIESPEDALYRNSLLMDKANMAAQNSKFANAVDMASTVIGAISGKGGSGGGTSITDFVDNPSGFDFSPFGDNEEIVPEAPSFIAAYGAELPPMTPVEVEGDEVGEMPDGSMIDFQGPTHEEGGIPVDLPAGTDIFSDRIKIDGVTMADRKKKRKRKEMSLEKLIEEYQADAVLKSSQKRLLGVNEQEDNFDMQLQQAIGAMMSELETNDDERPQYKFGDTIKKVANKVGENISLPTPGDVMGILGNIIQYRDAINTVQENRSGDLPNTNSFLNYGQDSLKSLDKSRSNMIGARDQMIKNVLDSTMGVQRAGRAGARSVNTARATDLAAFVAQNDALSKIQNDYLSQIAQTYITQSDLQKDIDAKVMAGEDAKNTANKQDRDAYYEALMQAKLAKGENISRIGKNLNQMLERKVKQNLLDNAYTYVKADGTTGVISQKNAQLVANLTPTKEQLEAMGVPSLAAWNSLSLDKKIEHYTNVTFGGDTSKEMIRTKEKRAKKK